MSDSKLNNTLWIIEQMTDYDAYHHGVVEVLAQKKTAFQEMTVVRSETYGKALVLDGKWQSCTGDEFLYHEPLVHVGCVYHGEPKNVLILGGGEGATVREVLKWKSVERVAMVDIDGDVVDACIEHLPEMHQGAFDDPRTELVVGDALHYLDNSQGEWDIIISDLSDPIEEGPSFKLFTKEYFEKCKRALKPDGYLVVQAGPLAPYELHRHARLVNTLDNVFDNVASYGSSTCTYGSPWGFAIAGSREIDRRPDPEAVDKMLKEKTTGNFVMFDGTTLLGIMQPAKHIRDAIAAENAGLHPG